MQHKKIDTCKRPIFFIHIMKTAGTSFRRMLEDVFGDEIYPSSFDLNKNSKGWYLNISEILDAVKTGSIDLELKRVICGHYSFALGQHLVETPFNAVFLRDPIERTISMIHHRKRRFPELESLSISEMLEDEKWVNMQIKDYQTKVFALDDIRKPSINMEYTIDDSAYIRAVSRLLSSDFVGITEEFKASVDLFNRLTGTSLGDIRSDNQGKYPDLTSIERDKIKNLVRYDIQLYKEGFTKFGLECARYAVRR